MSPKASTISRVSKKRFYEKSFQDWCLKSRSRYPYINLLRAFEKSYKELEPYQLAYTYIAESGLRIELVNFAGKFAKLSQVTKETPQEEIDKMINSLKGTATSFFKDYYMPIDKEVAAMLIAEYMKAQPADFRPEFLNNITDIQKFVDNMFDKSILASEASVNTLLDNFKAKDAKKLQKDPALLVYQNIIDFYRESVFEKQVSLNRENDSLQRIYMRGQMEMEPSVSRPMPISPCA